MYYPIDIKQQIHIFIVSKLSDNLKKYLEINNLSLRDFAKETGVSHSLISRLLKSPDPNKIQPKTKRFISQALQIEFDQLCNEDINFLIKNKEGTFKVPFQKISGEAVNSYIESNLEYSFAVVLHNDDYAPLFTEGTILYFSKEVAHQKDVCLVNYNNDRILCSVKESYRNTLKVVNLKDDKILEILRPNIIAVLMKSLHNQ
ncbi:helix-turn-helix domain-containing protein [Fangia hongkongensis]|uniref:helix-turn-helix domain-containing protein n=2 Tax=Fangia hongkongensis TaxID=270495 RepID=UPI00037FC3FD|nr:helix-turn-helix transcriptional regulator [Fangia hongkongensis]